MGSIFHDGQYRVNRGHYWVLRGEPVCKGVCVMQRNLGWHIMLVPDPNRVTDGHDLLMSLQSVCKFEESQSDVRKSYMLPQFMLIGVLSSAKFHSVAWLIDHAGLFVAWLFNVALTLALVFLATWTVVHVAPAAAGTPPPRLMPPRPDPSIHSSRASTLRSWSQFLASV